MYSRIETSCLYFFTVFVCVSFFFLSTAAAQTQDGPGIRSASENYTFETIDVPGVDFFSTDSK